MTNIILNLDPGTTLGSIIIGIIISVGSVIVIAILAWLLGPLNWPGQSRKIRKIILAGRRFRFVFNPGQGTFKYVTFLEDGNIGEGQNSNENRWRLRRGKLEILAFDGTLYSRFQYNPKTGRLEHTNDADCRSSLGQYFEAQFKSWEQERRTTP